MLTTARTIRLFVSSTFSDMKAERDALQRLVFPKLRRLCLSHGLRFQPIDLRWGVSEESGRHNRTMRICLRELKRCQQSGPKPNFLILLGDRYGWRPLPETIPADLFERMEATLGSGGLDSADRRARPGTHDALNSAMASPGQNVVELLRECYRRDDNAVPPEYVLQPRPATYDDDRWSSHVEPTLLAALTQAASEMGGDSRVRQLHLGLSATHQEILRGALDVEDARDHVGAFFRTIRYPKGETPPASFVDRANDQPDETAHLRLGVLKDQVASHIGPGTNVHLYSLDWRAEGRFTDADLKQFCDEALATLSRFIGRQIQEMTSVPAGEREEKAHAGFGAERRRGFVGREEPLRGILDALESGGKVLVVLGPAGSGKSALMAQAAKEALQRRPEAIVITRFIGATPASSNLISLLSDLVTAIRRAYPAPPTPLLPAPRNRAEGERQRGTAKARPRDEDVPVELEPLVAALNEALLRSVPDAPLFLFLDALDQLAAGAGAHQLRWLPGSLPGTARIVLSSAMPPAAVTTGPQVDVMRALEARGEAIGRLVLEKLNPENGALLLDRWTGESSRTLQDAQRNAILRAFAAEGNPLWLRTATAESCMLASCDDPPEFPPDTPGLMTRVLARLGTELEHGKLLVYRALGYLASARHGLAEDEMLDLLSRDPEVMQDFRERFPKSPPVAALPVAVWVAFLGDISPYVTEHEAQGAGLLRFYHRAFHEAVETVCLGGPGARQARHEHLAAYFESQGLFLASAGAGEHGPLEPTFSDLPNARKASELPWHLLRAAEQADPECVIAEVWDPAAALLCDLLFVEVKCRSELLYELQDDYRQALGDLPERQVQWAEERQREERTDRWIREIIEYSRKWSERRDRLARGDAATNPEPQLPAPPPSCRMWTQEEIDTECRRITEHPTRLDCLKVFARFVLVECYPLLNHGHVPGFTLQHAWSHAPGGPLHDAAGRLLPSCRVPLLARRWPPNARHNPKPALIRTLEGHTAEVESVAVTADGRRAISGSNDRTVRVWDLESGQCLRTLEGHSLEVKSVAVTPDGRRCISGALDHTLRVWDLESGQCLRVLETRDYPYPYTATLTADGRRAVALGARGTVCVWDTESGQCLRTLKGDTVAVTPDGRRVVITSDTVFGAPNRIKTLQVWDLETGQCLHTLEGHTAQVVSLAVTPDGRLAVSGSSDNAVMVWDVESGQCLRTHVQMDVHRAALTPDGRRAVSRRDQAQAKTLQVWDLETGQCLRTLGGEGATVNSVAVTSDGGRAVSGGDFQDTTVRIWDLESGQFLRNPKSHTAAVESVAVTADGRRAISGSSDKTVRVWDLETGRCLHTLEGHTFEVNSVAVTPDGRRALSASGDRTVRVWDLETGQCVHILRGHTNNVKRVAVTPDGRCAVSGSSDNTLRVWDLDSGQCLHTVKAHRLAVWNVPVTPDGRRALSTGYSERTLRVWDLKSGQCLHTLEGHRDRWVKSVAVTPDGRRAISGGSDGTLRVWDLETGQCLHTLEGHTAPVESVVLTRDGRRCISGDLSGALRVWDLESGQCLRTLRDYRNSRAETMTVTPDGRRIVWASDERTLRIWDLESGQSVSVFSVSAPIRTISLVGRGELICVGTVGGEVLVLATQGIKPGPMIVPDLSDEHYERVLTNGLVSAGHENSKDYSETVAHLQALSAHLKNLGKPGALPTTVAIARGVAALCPDNPEFRLLVADLMLRTRIFPLFGRMLRLASRVLLRVSLGLSLCGVLFDRSNRPWWLVGILALTLISRGLDSCLSCAVGLSAGIVCVLFLILDPLNRTRWFIAALLMLVSLFLPFLMDQLRSGVSWCLRNCRLVLGRCLVGTAAFFKHLHGH